MTTRDRIVEYVLGVGYDCRYDKVSGMLVILTPCYWVDIQGYVHPRIVEELVSVPADDYRAARELIDVGVGLEKCWGPCGLLQ
jgi:hypothetical protein